MRHKRLFNQPLELSTLPDTGFVKLPVVLRHFPVGRSTWYEGVKSGKYPASVKISERSVGWDVNDIRKLIAERNKQRD